MLFRSIVDGGQGLKFSPKFPKNVLQTSTTKLALRDTQDCMYALDLKPEQFKTSVDDSINIKKFTIKEASEFRNIQHVASSWDMYNDRIVHNVFDKTKRKIITFAKILQFDSMPLPQILTDLMNICKDEFRCNVEIEFAVNMDVPPGKSIIFNILQVRPITEYENKHNNVDFNKLDKSNALIYADNALGPGTIENIKDIIYVKKSSFDKLKTEDIVLEIDKFNQKMEKLGKDYLLIGPGRWGSSNKWLGVPIQWRNISKAKVIVETGLKDYPVEPSQGTHFFQNITSLGVGYITVNPQLNEGIYREEQLNELPSIEESHYVRHLQFDEELNIYINGKEGKALIEINN